MTKEIKKNHPSRPVGGAETGSQGREDSWQCGRDRERWWIVEKMGQAVRQLADSMAPHSRIDKLGGTAEEQNRLHNPGLQLGEIKPQTSD